MFRVVNHDGLQVAQYPSRSEFDSWAKISFAPNLRRANETDANNFEMHDEQGNMLYRVTGPKEVKPVEAAQPEE